jgi:hypothetical protein
MTQTTTILREIEAFLFGRKYYANIINTRGTGRSEISSFIFLTKEDAEAHRQDLTQTVNYAWLETISFRSRTDYTNLTTYHR